VLGQRAVGRFDEVLFIAAVREGAARRFGSLERSREGRLIRLSDSFLGVPGPRASQGLLAHPVAGRSAASSSNEMVSIRDC
jgi:hypothetical protein